MTYVPRPGELVRVLQVCETDPSPAHRVGDVFVAGGACARGPSGFAYVTESDSESASGTWAIVEPVAEQDEVLPVSKASFVLAFVEQYPNATGCGLLDHWNFLHTREVAFDEGEPGEYEDCRGERT